MGWGGYFDINVHTKVYLRASEKSTIGTIITPYRGDGGAEVICLSIAVRSCACCFFRSSSPPSHRPARRHPPRQERRSLRAARSSNRRPPGRRRRGGASVRCRGARRMTTAGRGHGDESSARDGCSVQRSPSTTIVCSARFPFRFFLECSFAFFSRNIPPDRSVSKATRIRRDKTTQLYTAVRRRYALNLKLENERKKF